MREGEGCEKMRCRGPLWGATLIGGRGKSFGPLILYVLISSVPRSTARRNSPVGSMYLRERKGKIETQLRATPYRNHEGAQTYTPCV